MREGNHGASVSSHRQPLHRHVMTQLGFRDPDAASARPTVRRRLAAWLALLAMVVTAVLPVSLRATEAAAIAHAVADDGTDDLVAFRDARLQVSGYLRQTPNLPVQRG